MLMVNMDNLIRLILLAGLAVTAFCDPFQSPLRTMRRDSIPAYRSGQSVAQSQSMAYRKSGGKTSGAQAYSMSGSQRGPQVYRQPPAPVARAQPKPRPVARAPPAMPVEYQEPYYYPVHPKEGNFAYSTARVYEDYDVEDQGEEPEYEEAPEEEHEQDQYDAYFEHQRFQEEQQQRFEAEQQRRFEAEQEHRLQAEQQKYEEEVLRYQEAEQRYHERPQRVQAPRRVQRQQGRSSLPEEELKKMPATRKPAPKKPPQKKPAPKKPAPKKQAPKLVSASPGLVKGYRGSMAGSYATTQGGARAESLAAGENAQSQAFAYDHYYPTDYEPEEEPQDEPEEEPEEEPQEEPEEESGEEPEDIYEEHYEAQYDDEYDNDPDVEEIDQYNRRTQTEENQRLQTEDGQSYFDADQYARHEDEDNGYYVKAKQKETIKDGDKTHKFKNTVEIQTNSRRIARERGQRIRSGQKYASKINTASKKTDEAVDKRTTRYGDGTEDSRMIRARAVKEDNLGLDPAAAVELANSHLANMKTRRQQNGPSTKS